MSATILRTPVVRTVVSSIQKLYPQCLADNSWDNTGVLLEPPSMPCISKASRHVVLLTTDLTSAVTSEALALPASVIITYHPIIFRPLKSLTLSDTQQVSLLRLAQAGISVYSPHTAVDAATGGVNDWLADGITGGAEAEVRRHCIQASALPPEGFENAGMGRVVELKAPQDLPTLVNRVKAHLGMERVMVVDGGRLVKTIGLCAGGGGKLLQQLKDVDLLYTGELSHHEALSARERGISVITCFHSNTERGFLKAVMREKLSEVLAEEWKKVAENEKDGKIGFEVVVSEADRDPFDIV